MNLRLKVLSPLLLVGALAQGHLLLVWLPENVQIERAEHIAANDAQLRSLASTLLVPVLDTDFAMIYGTLRTVMAERPYWRHLKLVDATGVVLYPLDPPDPPPLGHTVLRRSIDYLGEPVGSLVLDVDIDTQVHDRAASLRALVWIEFGVIAGFLLVSGLVLEYFVRRPVGHLSLASDRLSAGAFDVPLPRPSRDEVGRLVGSFRAMRDAIERYQRDLHDKVLEREQAERVQAGRSRVLERLAAGDPLAELLHALVREVEDTNPGMLCSVLLLDPGAPVLHLGAAPSLPDVYNDAIEGLPIGPQVGSCGTAAYTGKRVVVEDVATHPYWEPFRELARVANVRACWSEPVWSSEHTLLGTFAMYYREPCAPTPAQLAAISSAAALAGIAIERSRIETALRASERRFRAIYDDNPSMFFTVLDDATVASANDFAASQLGHGVSSLVGMSWLTLHHEDDRPRAQERLRRCLHEPGRVHNWENRKLRRDGAAMWVRESARAVQGEDGALAVLVVCEDITEARRLSEKLRFEATHDALTGLVNRREFEARLTRVLRTAQAENTVNALAFLDLDQFKVINDTCGHVAGDELLRQLGLVLRQHVGTDDTLARLGGDEFGVLMEARSLEEAREVAETIRGAIARFRFAWDEKLFAVGVSIGMVPVTCASGSVAAVLTAADNACYAAKDLGRSRIHVYREDDVELAGKLREMQWVSRIGAALDEDRLELWAQPVVPVYPTGQGVPAAAHHELLVRMRVEDGRLVPPGAFLPAAERYGLSPRIDRWVLGTALAWLLDGDLHGRERQTCAVNLSGLSLSDEDFLPFVIARLEATGVAPERVCFEVTETAAITSLSSASQFIERLERLGCRFALDDFGSGLSSFAYLKTLPVGFVKIDGMFVRNIVQDPVDFAMVKSIHDMARAMGKRTVAEFVESDAILGKLREIGVDFAQGYGIGPPRPIRIAAAPGQAVRASAS